MAATHALGRESVKQEEWVTTHWAEKEEEKEEEEEPVVGMKGRRK